MTEIDGYVHIAEVPTTEEASRTAQGLILRDFERAGHPDPTSQANPNNPGKVKTQQNRIITNPERYSGFQQLSNAELVAFMKTNEWRSADEAPYPESFTERTRYSVASKLGKHTLEPKAFGVLALVVNEEVQESDQEIMVRTLLTDALTRGALQAAKVINIPIHDHDPIVLDVALDMGFERVGRKAEAAGAPGFKQFRYQREIE